MVFGTVLFAPFPAKQRYQNRCNGVQMQNFLLPQGFINSVSKWVLLNALIVNNSWQAYYQQRPGITLAVDITSHSRKNARATVEMSLVLGTGKHNIEKRAAYIRLLSEGEVTRLSNMICISCLKSSNNGEDSFCSFSRTSDEKYEPTVEKLNSSDESRYKLPTAKL
jgi:hypothetical protein